MFRDSTAVPLNVLSLDYGEPQHGWSRFLSARNIPLIADDLGRPAISRQALATLLAKGGG
jgi:hypothetical protein